MQTSHSFRSLAAGSLLVCLAAAGCSSGVVVHVVDLDNGSRPIAGATVERYPVPRRHGDAFATTPSAVYRTDDQGKAVIQSDSGRLIVRAPDKAAASIYSTFLPHNVELGVSASPAATSAK